MYKIYHLYIVYMSYKYEEHISGITIEYNKKIHKCPFNYCYRLKNNQLGKIEDDIGHIKYDIDENKTDEDYYNYEEEVELECDCGNEMKFTYNSYEIIKKYL